MADTPNITPALREWCRRLSMPKHCQLLQYGRMNYLVRGTGSVAKPTYVTVAKLEDAGLIRWEDHKDDKWPFALQRAVLTPTGELAATSKEKARV